MNMKVSKTVCLDERTAMLAASKNNLSEWVRARLLEEDENAITEEEMDDFTRMLAELPTYRLVAMAHNRLQAEVMNWPLAGLDDPQKDKLDLHEYTQQQLMKWLVEGLRVEQIDQEAQA
jgi:hypothetical protein